MNIGGVIGTAAVPTVCSDSRNDEQPRYDSVYNKENLLTHRHSGQTRTALYHIFPTKESSNFDIA